MLCAHQVGRASLASIFCLFLSSTLFSQYATIAGAKRPTPAFKPPASVQRTDSRSKDIEKSTKLALAPTVIYYPKRESKNVSSSSAPVAAKPLELLKPVTIYYRTWGPPASPVVSTEAKTVRRAETLTSAATTGMKTPANASSLSPSFAKRPNEQLRSAVSPTALVRRSGAPTLAARPLAKMLSDKPSAPAHAVTVPVANASTTAAEQAAIPTELPEPAKPTVKLPAANASTTAAEPAAIPTELPEPAKPAVKLPAVEPVRSEPVETSIKSAETSKSAEAVAQNVEQKPAAPETITSETEATSATLPEPDQTNNQADKKPSEAAAPGLATNTEAAPRSVQTQSHISHPESNVRMSAIALNNSAVELSKNSQFEEAERLLDQAIEQDPSIYKFYRNLSIVYENTNRMDKALEAAEKAAQLAPGEPTVLMQLCGLKLVNRKDAEAVACYEQLNELAQPDDLTLMSFGLALLRTGKTDEAISTLEKARGSGSGPALNALGVAYFEKERFRDALATFKTAVEADPDRCEIRFNLALAQLATRNREGAISQYRLIKGRNHELADQLFQIIFHDKVLSVDQLKGH